MEILFSSHATGRGPSTWAALDPDVVRFIATPNWRLSNQAPQKLYSKRPSNLGTVGDQLLDRVMLVPTTSAKARLFEHFIIHENYPEASLRKIHFGDIHYS